jgi:hypothetical protein
MNISCGLLIVVCPCIVALYDEIEYGHDSFYNTLKVAFTSTGVGFAAATVIVRILFHVANMVFGAPGQLANAVAGVLMGFELRGITDPPEEKRMDPELDGKFVTYAEWSGVHDDEGLSEHELQARWGRLQKAGPGHEIARKLLERCELQNPNRGARELALKVIPDDVVPMGGAVTTGTTRGLLWSLYRKAGGRGLSLPLEHFELFAALSAPGYVIAFLDPEYTTMSKHGFSRQFFTNAIHIDGQLIMEKFGTWTVKHSAEAVQARALARAPSASTVAASRLNDLRNLREEVRARDIV